jgi:hypothetical protein
MVDAVVGDLLFTDEEVTTSNDDSWQKMELNLTWDVKTDGRPLIRATVLLLLLRQEGKRVCSSGNEKSEWSLDSLAGGLVCFWWVEVCGRGTKSEAEKT